MATLHWHKTEISDLTRILGALAFLLVVRWVSRMRRMPKGLRLPPGPPGKLIFGNASDMPTHHEWETYAQWGKTYGGLVHVKILSMHMIFVNSPEIAHELFEKRSSLYSDRFNFTMMNDLMGFDWGFGIMRYGERWRRHRRTFNKKFHRNATVAYYDVQTKQMRNFLRILHESPENFTKHIRHFAGAIIMEITYGIKVLPDGDPYIGTAEKAAAAMVDAGNPGDFLVDTLPLLKHVPAWMPGAEFRRKARAWRVPITEIVTKPFQFVKTALAAGTAEPSVLASLLEDLAAKSDAPPDEEEVIRNAAAVAYLGGADTLVSALSTFVLAMVLHPEVQRKAQDQLDAVVGMDRLPAFEDRKHLPYIDALCNEALRWHPGLPLGVAHRVMRDDVYDDLFIPEGSVVIGNSWAMLRDEKLFGPEPHKFIPERFLRPDAKDPTFAFGYGRRICPGRHMADNSIFIAVASVLKVFNITHARNRDGDEIPVKEAYTSGFISYPEPFQCDIKLRPGIAESLFSGDFN